MGMQGSEERVHPVRLSRCASGCRARAITSSTWAMKFGSSPASPRHASRYAAISSSVRRCSAESQAVVFPLVMFQSVSRFAGSLAQVYVGLLHGSVALAQQDHREGAAVRLVHPVTGVF